MNLSHTQSTMLLLTLYMLQYANALLSAPLFGYHSVAMRGVAPFRGHAAMTTLPKGSALYYKNLDDHEEQQNRQQQQRQQRQNDGLSETSSTPTQDLIQDIKNSSDGFDVLIEEELTTGSYYRDQNLRLSGYSKDVNAIDLPKTAFVIKSKSSTKEDEEIMLSIEMFVGRIAMIVAIYLSMEMILTGSSVLDKIQTL